MTVMAGIIMANQQYVKGGPHLPAESLPSKKLAVVTCMDVRIDPLAALGLSLGEAHILRNAGARVTDDVIRSLTVSQQLLGTEAILVLPHSRCGMLGMNPGEINPQKSGPVDRLEFYPITDLQEVLVADLASLANSPWISPHTELCGAIYDVDSGYIRPL